MKAKCSRFRIALHKADNDFMVNNRKMIEEDERREGKAAEEKEAHNDAIVAALAKELGCWHDDMADVVHGTDSEEELDEEPEEEEPDKSTGEELGAGWEKEIDGYVSYDDSESEDDSELEDESEDESEDELV
jgi:hypothetical protein